MGTGGTQCSPGYRSSFSPSMARFSRGRLPTKGEQRRHYQYKIRSYFQCLTHISQQLICLSLLLLINQATWLFGDVCQHVNSTERLPSQTHRIREYS